MISQLTPLLFDIFDRSQAGSGSHFHADIVTLSKHAPILSRYSLSTWMRVLAIAEVSKMAKKKYCVPHRTQPNLSCPPARLERYLRDDSRIAMRNSCFPELYSTVRCYGGR